MNSPRRLSSENFSLPLPVGDGVIHLDITIARDETGRVVEVAFGTRGKIGSGLDQMLTDLGVMISRAIQRRDPVTGELVE